MNLRNCLTGLVLAANLYSPVIAQENINYNPTSTRPNIESSDYINNLLMKHQGALALCEVVGLGGFVAYLVARFRKDEKEEK